MLICQGDSELDNWDAAFLTIYEKALFFNEEKLEERITQNLKGRGNRNSNSSDTPMSSSSTGLP